MTEACLVVDFAGELHRPDPDGVFVIGRTGDLEIDDNPYLHRAFIEIVHAEGLWWVANVGSRLAAHLTDQHGVLRCDGEHELTADEIMKMDWFCDNVDGALPGFDELLPKSQGLVRLRCGESFLLARVTHRSLHALGVAPGSAVWAQVKSVAIVP